MAMAYDDHNNPPISPSLIIGLRLPFARKEEEHDEDHLGYGDGDDSHYSDNRPEDTLTSLFHDMSSDDDAVAEDARVCALSIARCLQDMVRSRGDKAAIKRQFRACCELVDRYMSESDKGEQGGNYEDGDYGR
jgi:hypothetical protein